MKTPADLVWRECMKRAAGIGYLFAAMAILTAALAVGLTYFCREKLPVLVSVPEEASMCADHLMAAVCDGDYQEAQTMLYGMPDLGLDRKPEHPIGEMIWEAYLRSLDYILVGEVYATECGLAQDVKLISMEPDSVTKNLGIRAQHLLNEKVNTAQYVSELYDAENEYREDLVMEVLQEAARQALEEDTRYTYRILQLPLVYGDGQWWVEPEEGCGAILDRFDMGMTNVLSDALQGILSIEKAYWLHDEDVIAPKPAPEKYGETADPGDLEEVIRKAEMLLDGQELAFRTDAEIMEDSVITYYLDETILCITWQHTVGKAVYTCSEVKIAHPSQFRRFLSDGKFGSGKLYKATEMASSVNAITASNGDYYAFRGYGNLVYNGDVKMAGNRYLDTCYVDRNGDLILVDMGELYRKEDVERFVEDNDIRFSVAFGPILIEDGRVVAKHYYALGETDDFYSRAALCQMGPMHYMLVTVNRRGQDVTRFAKHLQEMGAITAYALDGGQTSTIVTGNKLINPVDYGGERETSDIIYFATAVPDGG